MTMNSQRLVYLLTSLELPLRGWCDVRSMCRLDASLCNREIRPHYLEALRGVCIQKLSDEEKSTDIERGFLLWIRKRRINVKEVNVIGVVKKDVALYEEIFTSVGRFVEAVHFYHLYGEQSCNRHYIAVAGSCAILRTIRFTECEVDESMLLVLLKSSPIAKVEFLDSTVLRISANRALNFPYLRHVAAIGLRATKKKHDGNNYALDVLRKVVVGNTNLESLHLVGVGHHGEKLISVIEGTSNLCSLCITDMENLTDETVQKIVTMHKETLTNVEISGHTGLTDLGVELLVKTCQDLRFLRLSQNTQITELSLFAIADHCVHLRALDVSNCRRVSVHGVRRVFNTCQSLVSFKCGWRHSDDDDFDYDDDIDNDTMQLPTWTVYDLLPYLPKRIVTLELADESNNERDVELLIQHGQNVQKLNVADCSIFTEQRILANVHKLPNLKKLWVSYHNTFNKEKVPPELYVGGSVQICAPYDGRIWYKTFDTFGLADIYAATRDD